MTVKSYSFVLRQEKTRIEQEMVYAMFLSKHPHGTLVLDCRMKRHVSSIGENRKRSVGSSFKSKSNGMLILETL